jgi:hypothetical protein
MTRGRRIPLRRIYCKTTPPKAACCKIIGDIKVMRKQAIV